jgi:hypothetical protein
MARVLKREAAKLDLISQWLWYAEEANRLPTESLKQPRAL